MKQFTGIIAAALYGFSYRLIAHYEVFDVNSFTFFIVVPAVIGFIPFFLNDKIILKSIAKAVFYPLLADLVFVITSMLTGLEDMICILIIGLPYIVVSVLISISLRLIINSIHARKSKLNGEYDDDYFRNAVPFILIIPLILGKIEKQFPKIESNQFIAEELIIDKSPEVVWKLLKAVPDIRNVSQKTLINYLGVPQPVFSTYDEKRNVRIGYFNNNMRLNEMVTAEKVNQYVVFHIETEKSDFGSSPTINHIFKGKNVVFDFIRYDLQQLPDGRTKLKLSTKYVIYSNLSFYGKFWAAVFIRNFEQNLLQSLKKVCKG